MIDHIGSLLAEGGVFTLLGFTSIAAGSFLLLCWHVTRPQDGRTGVHRDGALTPARHRKEGTPGEATRVLRYDTAVARARVEPPDDDGSGWFYNFVLARIELLDADGNVVRSITEEDYATRKGAIDKDLFVAGLPMIPDVIPYIETRRQRDRTVRGRSAERDGVRSNADLR